MKKIILYLLMICLLAGCNQIYNLNDFTVPDDVDFLALIDSLDTPYKICEYMKENFDGEVTLWESYSPYQMWLLNRDRAGDCNDYSCFAVFVANYHGYETYQIHIFIKGQEWSHFIAVYVENGKYTFSSAYCYFPIHENTFKDVIKHYSKDCSKYMVYDYNMNIIETDKLRR